MPLVSIAPSSADRPYLKTGGEYGPGRTHESDVELVSFECPSEKGPGYDRDCHEDSYCQFNFQVKHPDFGLVFVSHWETLSEGSGSRALEFINNIMPEGVDMDTGTFDPDQVAPRKCAIEVRDPRQGKDGRWWTGNVTNVFGV